MMMGMNPMSNPMMGMGGMGGMNPMSNPMMGMGGMGGMNPMSNPMMGMGGMGGMNPMMQGMGPNMDPQNPLLNMMTKNQNPGFQNGMNPLARAAQNNLMNPHGQQNLNYANTSQIPNNNRQKKNTRMNVGSHTENKSLSNSNPNSQPGKRHKNPLSQIFSDGAVMIEEIEVDEAGNELARNYRYLQNQESIDKELGKKIDTKDNRYQYGGYAGSVSKNRVQGAPENDIRNIIQDELANYFSRMEMGMGMPSGGGGFDPYQNKGPNGMPFSSGQMILYKHLTDKMFVSFVLNES
jgi:hypothetical protein